MKNTIITIGREYGSGGHELGARLAARLGVPFYDDELIELAAEKSGFNPNYIKDTDEKSPGIFSRTVMLSRGNAYGHMTPEDDLFIHQSAVMNELAEKGAFVVVGRCADYILRDRKNVLKIFIYAPIEDRVKRKLALGADGKNEREVRKKIIAADRQRERYYNFYTGMKWGDSRNYDICLDTSKAGIDASVDLVISFLDKIKNKGILPDR